MGSSTHSATLPGQLQCFNAVPFSFVSMNCDIVLLSPFLSHQLRYSILVGIGKFEHYQQRAVWSLWSPYTYILMKAYWYYGVGREGGGGGVAKLIASSFHLGLFQIDSGQKIKNTDWQIQVFDCHTH